MPISIPRSLLARFARAGRTVEVPTQAELEVSLSAQSGASPIVYTEVAGQVIPPESLIALGSNVWFSEGGFTSTGDSSADLDPLPRIGMDGKNFAPATIAATGNLTVDGTTALASLTVNGPTDLGGVKANVDSNRLGFFSSALSPRQAVSPIADPATATAEDVANAYNALLAVLGSTTGYGLVNDA